MGKRNSENVKRDAVLKREREIERLRLLALSNAALVAQKPVYEIDSKGNKIKIVKQ